MSDQTSHLISVIVPAHNAGAYLADALESIRAQDHQPIETLVVDDGSTDHTAEIARRFPAVSVLHQNRLGPAGARNTGVAAAQGNWLAFLDADDWWAPAKLSRQLAALTANPDHGLAICRLRPVLEAGAEWPAGLNRAHYESEPAALVPSALLMPRTTWERVGPFDPAFGLSDDADWLIRAKDAGVTVAVVPDVLLFKRLHANNLTRQTAPMGRSLLRALRASVGRQRAAGRPSDSEPPTTGETGRGE